MSKTRDQIADEALDALRGKHRAGIAVTVSGGKTRIGLRHAAENYTDTLRVLVVAPKLSIFKSWKEEMLGAKLGFLLPHVTFTTYLSLPKQDRDYDIIYLDECHSLIEESHDPWLSGYRGMIVGLTGTKPKWAASGKGRMVEKYCPIVYEYTTDSAVNDKIINDYRIIVHQLPLGTTKNVPVSTASGKSTFYTSELASYEYWSGRIEKSFGKALQISRIMRMRAMMGFPSKERYAKQLLAQSTGQCIVFANTKEQADRLCKDSYYSGNQRSEENLEAFKAGKITKLSSVLQLVEGINILNLEEGVIMHAYGNERKTRQRIGRLLRLPTDQIATIHILCYRGTVDVKWVEDSLSDLDPAKIRWIDDAAG